MLQHNNSENNINPDVSSETADKTIGVQLNVSGNLFIVTSRFNTTNFSSIGRHGISSFSESSGRRMRKYLRECTSIYSHMLTLTYPFTYEEDGKKFKDHLRRMLQELKREYEREKGNIDRFSAFWFMEFQERGAPHFHIFITKGFKKDWVAKRWYLICQTDDERHLHAGTRIEKLHAGRAGTISYATKYATKLSQKTVPENISNCGRFWGVCGVRDTVSAATTVPKALLGAPQVKRRTEKIKELIKKAIFDKKAFKLGTKREGSMVVAFKNKSDLTEIKRNMDFLTILVAVNSRKCDTVFDTNKNVEELEEDLCQSFV